MRNPLLYFISLALLSGRAPQDRCSMSLEFSQGDGVIKDAAGKSIPRFTNIWADRVQANGPNRTSFPTAELAISSGAARLISI